MLAGNVLLTARSDEAVINKTGQSCSPLALTKQQCMRTIQAYTSQTLSFRNRWIYLAFYLLDIVEKKIYILTCMWNDKKYLRSGRSTIYSNNTVVHWELGYLTAYERVYIYVNVFRYTVPEVCLRAHTLQTRREINYKYMSTLN